MLLGPTGLFWLHVFVTNTKLLMKKAKYKYMGPLVITKVLRYVHRVVEMKIVETSYFTTMNSLRELLVDSNIGIFLKEGPNDYLHSTVRFLYIICIK